jgi:hypothetical protein
MLRDEEREILLATQLENDKTSEARLEEGKVCRGVNYFERFVVISR